MVCSVLINVQANPQKELNQLQSDIKQQQHSLEQFSYEKKQLTHQLRRSDLKLGKLNQQTTNVRQQLVQQRNELQQLHLKRETLSSLQSVQKKQLEQQVVTAFYIQHQSAGQLLFSHNDPQLTHRLFSYYRYFNQARIQQLDDLIFQVHRIDQLSDDIQKKERLLSTTEHDLLKQNKSLLYQQEKHRTLLKKMDVSILSKQQTLQQNEHHQKALQSLIDQSLSASPPISNLSLSFVEKKGSLPFPVKGHIIKTFGQKKDTGHTAWNGWLIQAKKGTAVKAIHPGQVVFSNWLNGLGLLIVIDHNEGYLSLYARNQSLFKQVGETVHAGDTIATVGSSGGYRLARLYFEIRYQGKPLNPDQWFVH